MSNLTPFEQAQNRMPVPPLPPYAKKVSQEAVGPQTQFTAPPSPQIAPKVRLDDEPSLADQVVSAEEAARRDAVNQMLQPEQTAPAPQVEESAPAAPIRCVHCGQRCDGEHDEISREDKQGFLRHVYGMGAQPFTKTYKLLNGSIEVTFRNRSAKVDGLCDEQVLREIEDGRIYSKDPTLLPGQFIARKRQLMLACSLERISTIPAAFPVMGTPEATQRWPAKTEGPRVINSSPAVAYQEFLDNWSAPLLLMVHAEWQKFENLVFRMTAAAANPSFWEGIDGNA